MKSLLKLAPYFKPHIGLLITGALLGIPLAFLRFAPVPMVKFLMDDLLLNRDETKLYLFPILIIGLFAD